MARIALYYARVSKGTETAVEISSPNLSCYSYAKYFVFVRGSMQGEMVRGDDILVRTKVNKQEQILCKYGVKPGDFELKVDLGQSFGGITNDLMLVDTGIGPNQERFLSIYNLSSRNQVYKTTYLAPIELPATGQVSFWRLIKFATMDDCSNAQEVTSAGLRPTIEKKFVLELRTFDLQETSLSRCGGLE